MNIVNFYDRLKNVCDEKGIKITTLIVECGGNKGSITSWKNGTIPNYGIVSKLAESLDVSVDYLVGNEEIDIQPKKYFNTIEVLLASKYKYINLCCLNDISEDELREYTDYLNCGLKYLLNRTSVEYIPVKENRLSSDINGDLTEDILDIMSSLPGSDDVRFIQIQISRIVIYNLLNSGISYVTICNFKCLNKANLKFLMSKEYDYIKAGAYGFTSDELRGIRKENRFSYYYMFTGVMTEKDKELHNIS